MVLSVDVGYGDVKAFGGVKKVKFPSAIAPYSFGGSERPHDDFFYSKEKVYHFDGDDYLLGEMALLDENCKTSRSQEFIEKYSPLFVYAVMERLNMLKKDGENEIDRLAVGIPLTTFVSPAAESFKKRYKEKLKKFVVDNNLVKVKEVDVFAQGHGIYIDYLTANKKSIDETVLVVDIGFNTVDILAVVKGTPRKKGSTTLRNRGVIKVVSNLREYIKEAYGIEVSEQGVKDILNKGGFKLYGNFVDLGEKIESIVKDYSEWLFNEIKSQKDEFLQSADKLIVAGGGAYYVKNAIPEEYRGFVFIPQEPEFANARGYYTLSLSKGL